LSSDAATVPFELVAPWITTESPGRIAFVLTERFLVIFVAEESLTLTMPPELELMSIVLPFTLLTVPIDALPAPSAPAAGKPLRDAAPVPARPVAPLRAADGTDAGSEIPLVLEPLPWVFSTRTPA
jgi:hypothetical protein